MRDTYHTIPYHISDFYERHVINNIETHLEAQIIITKFEECLERLKSCHSKLRVALAGGYEDNYRDINEFFFDLFY